MSRIINFGQDETTSKEAKIVWYPDRESNSDLIFRRDLFYPLNYQGKKD